jgi:hypothetical protein
MRSPWGEEKKTVAKYAQRKRKALFRAGDFVGLEITKKCFTSSFA